MSILFLVEQNTLVRQVDERLEVFKYKQRLMDIPLCKLEAVVVYGQVVLTTPTLRILNQRSIPSVTYLKMGELSAHCYRNLILMPCCDRANIKLVLIPIKLWRLLDNLFRVNCLINIPF